MIRSILTFSCTGTVGQYRPIPPRPPARNRPPRHILLPCAWSLRSNRRFAPLALVTVRHHRGSHLPPHPTHLGRSRFGLDAGYHPLLGARIRRPSLAVRLHFDGPLPPEIRDRLGPLAPDLVVLLPRLSVRSDGEEVDGDDGEVELDYRDGTGAGGHEGR